MFPEYRELISTLKTQDAHFAKLFNRHNDIDQTIKNMESGVEPGSEGEIENLKKEKLKHKDELYLMLKKVAA